MLWAGVPGGAAGALLSFSNGHGHWRPLQPLFAHLVPQLTALPTEGCQHGTPPWLAWSPAPNPLLFQTLFQKLDVPQGRVVSET